MLACAIPDANTADQLSDSTEALSKSAADPAAWLTLQQVVSQ